MGVSYTTHIPRIPCITTILYFSSTMVKAVCVLNGDSSVTGTVHFEQEGSGPVTVTGRLLALLMDCTASMCINSVTTPMGAPVPGLISTWMGVNMVPQLMPRGRGTQEILG